VKPNIPPPGKAGKSVRFINVVSYQGKEPTDYTAAHAYGAANVSGFHLETVK
jgi:hypothetical protein